GKNAYSTKTGARQAEAPVPPHHEAYSTKISGLQTDCGPRRVPVSCHRRRCAEASRSHNRDGYSARAPVQVSSTRARDGAQSAQHTSELQSRGHLVCRLLLEKKKKKKRNDKAFPV